MESIQKKAAKLVSSCKDMSYLERLKYLKLPTLKYCKLMGDTLEVYKILNNITCMIIVQFHFCHWISIRIPMVTPLN